MPALSASSSATHGTTEETFVEGTNGAFIKTERMVSGVHFLTDREEERTDLLLPKSEAGENEPEVRKQVGFFFDVIDTRQNQEKGRCS